MITAIILEFKANSYRVFILTLQNLLKKEEFYEEIR